MISQDKKNNLINKASETYFEFMYINNSLDFSSKHDNLSRGA